MRKGKLLQIDDSATLVAVPGEMDGKKVTINGKTFVAELFWQPLVSPRNHMAEAKKYGKTHGWDIVAIRKYKLRVQAGFIKKDVGAVKGMYSLAATLAGELGVNWLGAFELPDGRFFVCAVKDASIVPGFDRIVGSRDEALGLLNEANQLIGTSDEHIYAPAAFEFCERSLDLVEFLQPKRLKADYRLKQLRFGLTRKEWIVLGSIFLLIVAGILAAEQYAAHRKRLQVAEMIRKQTEERQRLEALNAQAKKTQTVKALEHPWASMPSGHDFAQACTRRLDAVPLSVGGWMLEVATCDSKGVAVAYRRPKGTTTVEAFASEAPVFFRGEPAFSENGDLALVGLPLGVAFAGDEPLMELTPLLNGLVSYFQGRDVAVKLEEQKVEIPAPAAEPGQPAVAPPEPTWRKYTMDYVTEEAPVVHLDDLANRPGVRITEIKMTLDEANAALKWKVQGEIYAAR